MSRRVLPHNLDAEASILGGVLLRNDVLSQLLCVLEDRGLITRRISLTDRRVEQISLTPRGDRIVEIALSVSGPLHEDPPPGWPLNIEPSINALGILIGFAALICT